MTHIARAASRLTSFTLLLFIALLLGCSEDAPEPIDLVIKNVALADALISTRTNQKVSIDQGRIVDIVSGELHDAGVANAFLPLANPVEDITHTPSIDGVTNQGFFLSRTQLDHLVID